MSKGNHKTNLNKNPFFYPHVMLRDLFERYPEFYKGGKIELVACVYLPIAELELDTLEASSEEFETIEHSVLELAYAGIDDTSQIAAMLGLPEKFIKKITNILEGYGHITEDLKLKELGLRSIKEGVKYQEYNTRLKVQTEPISCSLLTKEMQQPSIQLVNPNETKYFIPHIPPDPHANWSILESLDSNLDKFRKSKSSVFYINLKKINNLISSNIKFAYAFMIKFANLPDPVITLKCKRTEQVKKADEVYYWKPVALTEIVKSQLNLQKQDIEMVSPKYQNTLYQLKKDICKQSEYIITEHNFPSKVKTLIKSDWCIDPDNLNYYFDENQKPVVYFFIEPEQLIKVDDKFLKSLYHYDVGIPLQPYARFAAKHEYPGLVCYAKTNDQLVLELAHQLQTKLTTYKDFISFYHDNKDALDKDKNLNNTSVRDKLNEIMSLVQKLSVKKTNVIGNAKQVQEKTVASSEESQDSTATIPLNITPEIQITCPQDLVKLAEDYWNEIISLITSRKLQWWLKESEETTALSILEAELKQNDSIQTAWQKFLDQNPWDQTKILPKLQVKAVETKFSKVIKGDNITVKLHIFNSGKGIVYGEIIDENARTVPFTGNSQIDFVVDTSSITVSNDQYQGELTVKSNGGNAKVPFSVSFLPPLILSDGQQIENPAQLINFFLDHKYEYHQEFIEIIESGKLRSWLVDHGEEHAAEILDAQIDLSDSYEQALDRFIQNNPWVSVPILEVKPIVTSKIVSLPALTTGNEQITFKIHIQNRGRRRLRGIVRDRDTGSEYELDTHDSQEVIHQAKAKELISKKMNKYTGLLEIDSNGGKEQVTYQAAVRGSPDRFFKATLAKSIFPALLFSLSYLIYLALLSEYRNNSLFLLLSQVFALINDINPQALTYLTDYSKIYSTVNVFSWAIVLFVLIKGIPKGTKFLANKFFRIVVPLISIFLAGVFVYNTMQDSIGFMPTIPLEIQKVEHKIEEKIDLKVYKVFEEDVGKELFYLHAEDMENYNLQEEQKLTIYSTENDKSLSLPVREHQNIQRGQIRMQLSVREKLEVEVGDQVTFANTVIKEKKPEF